MPRDWYVRLTVLLGVCALAVYGLYPSYYFYSQASAAQKEDLKLFCGSMPSWMHCSKLNLGLDLQGGVHLVMGVRVDKAIEHRLERLSESIADFLRDKAIPFERSLRLKKTQRIQLVLQEVGDAVESMRELRKHFPILDAVKVSEKEWQFSLKESEEKIVKDSAVEQSIKTIRNRADKLGVTEPTIARRGEDQILIQLPGVKDPEHAIAIIGRTAQLEFTVVRQDESAAFADISSKSLPEGVSKQGSLGKKSRSRRQDVYFELPEQQEEAIRLLLQEKIPEGTQLAFGALQDVQGMEKKGFLRTYLLDAHPGITGDYLTNAQVQQNPELPSDYYVMMTFDGEGAKIFGRLTEDNVGKAMAIVLDGRVSSAPVIQEKIAGGQARITLGRGVDAQAKFQEAKDLSLVLKAGALPAPVEVREKRQVGKTLGQDTVAKGTTAMMVGALLVVLFMVLYYRASGLIANVALILNVLLLMALLAAIEATLTLPGMAGIVLTVGMAVDANVLIFERIREELRLGSGPKLAIEAGYRKAFSTIFDSNITTLIAGVVLMQYGSGPVRGFAVTLIIGLTCSMYTAIVVTRLIYDFILHHRRLTTLSI